MSSINSFPTFKYHQPKSYCFSHDSVFLARQVFEKHSHEISQPDFRILDLCAGCGVVGMDLLFHQLKEASFDGEVDFLEIQEIYKSYFEVNQQTLQNYFPDQKLKTNWLQKNYTDLNDNKKYDLIISNPPYFLKENGMLSDNEFKNRCRFFLDASWMEMIVFMKNSLKENGKAYFLVRDELKNIIQKENYFNTAWPRIDFPFQIRGTWVACFKN
jgi:tRNA1(Val) A37 N6-methylase TrmN6